MNPSKMKVERKTNRDGSEQVMLGSVIMKEKPARFRADRQEWKFSLEFLRVREIEKLIRHRHGPFIPDPTGTEDEDMCLAYVRAVALTPQTQDVASWCAKWAPWIDAVTIQMIALAGVGRRRMIKADPVAKLLMVTNAERQRLSLRTIGACDLSPAERRDAAKENKRERDRNRQAEQRRAQGRISRASYEATSLSRLKPWEAEGISRRTWERRVASVSQVDKKGKSDTPASKPDFGLTATPVDKGQARAAGLVAGLGDHPPAGLQGAVPHGNGDTLEGEAA